MIKKIVKEVFNKAESEYASTAKTTLSKHISEEIQEIFNIYISDRTISRSYDKYILSKKIGSLTPENVDILCKYLGYEDYSKYRKENLVVIPILKKKPYYLLTIIAVILLLIFLLKNYNNKSVENISVQCMFWKKTKYIEVSCNKLLPNTKVIPIDRKLMENMKKVILKRSTIIFSSEGEPLYWYSKLNSKEVAFFTSPGLHPVTGKTLKAITATIFNKYVPIHTNIENSFVSP